MEQVVVLEEVKAVNPRAGEAARLELIRLEDQRAAGADTDRQIERLIRTRRAELLGPLAKVLERVEYERGRPVKAGLQARPKTFFDVLDDQGWDTIRELDLSHCSLQALIGPSSPRVREISVGRVGEFLSTLEALRVVRGLARNRFPEVPVPSIEEATVADVDLELIAERLPSLKRLSLRHWGEREANWAHPVLARLERFSLNDAITFEHGVARFSEFCLESGVSEWVAHYPNLKRVEVPDTAVNERLTDQLHACFKAVRLRGVEVVLIEGRRSDWWGANDDRYALRWG